jgi:pimeloyl-ACP methyl ester carboxylesterase
MPHAELTDIRAYYETGGIGHPLLLIPGLGTTCRVWVPIRKTLEKHFSVIAPDLRGIGGSTAKRRPRSLADYCVDLLELLDHLQVEKAHVLGLSLGGIVAQRFALDHPQRVSRAVLVSCAHRPAPYLHEIAALMGLMLRWFPRRWFAWTLELLSSGPTYLDADPERLQRATQKYQQLPVARAWVLRQLRCLLAARAEAEAGYQIQCPTLVIAGEHDMLIPNCYARRMANQIPDSRFMLVTEAGHNPLAECPHRVLPAVVDFLKTRRAVRFSAPQAHPRPAPSAPPSHPYSRTLTESIGAWKHEGQFQ